MKRQPRHLILIAIASGAIAIGWFTIAKLGGRPEAILDPHRELGGDAIAAARVECEGCQSEKSTSEAAPSASERSRQTQDSYNQTEPTSSIRAPVISTPGNAGVAKPGNQASGSARVVLAATALERYRTTVWQDCHAVISREGCAKLIETFTRVLEAPDGLDDGWSAWMEDQIQGSLSAKMHEYKATFADVKCASEGCVLIVYANSAKDMFDNGWQSANEFDNWLRTQSWNDWLEPNSKLNGNKSTVEWRVVGMLNAKPFINWYVVTRRQ